MEWTPNVSDGHFTGWDPAAEPRAQLLASAVGAADWMSDIDGRDLPVNVDPRPWHQIESQGNVGSCQGHANTSVCEALYHAVTGEKIQLCRMFAYRGTQVIDGIDGGDLGSTIDGGAKFAKQVGHCVETVWPYSGRYEYKIPRACYEQSVWAIKNHVSIRTASQAHQFIGSGQGFALLGMMWERAIDDQVGAGRIVTQFRGNGRGGHAIAVLGYTFVNGVLCFIVANSWSTKWGMHGWFLVSSQAFDQILRHRWTVCIGFSDLDTPRKRRINWATEMEI